MKMQRTKLKMDPRFVAFCYNVAEAQRVGT